jgi:hypothetical protein
VTPSATAVTHRLAAVALTGAVLVPVAGLLAAPAYAEDAAGSSATPTVDIGEPAFVEETPDPVTGLYPGQAVPGTDGVPGTGGWITGGTLQEGSQAAGPVAAPKPAVRPVTVTAPAARPVTVSRPARRARPTAGGTAATVLPFTGPGRLSVQLTVGAGMVLVGVVLSAVTRSKGTSEHAG